MAERVICKTRTTARRHPIVLGKIGGYSLPWQLSAAQLVVMIGGAILLFFLRPLWGHFGALNAVILVGVPIVAAVLVRQARVEGRDALRWLLGLAVASTRPRAAMNLGQPVRTKRCVRPEGRTWVTRWGGER